MKIAAAQRLVQAHNGQDVRPDRQLAADRTLVEGRRRIHRRVAAGGLVAVHAGRLRVVDNAAEAVGGVGPLNFGAIEVRHKAVVVIDRQ